MLIFLNGLVFKIYRLSRKGSRAAIDTQFEMDFLFIGKI